MKRLWLCGDPLEYQGATTRQCRLGSNVGLRTSGGYRKGMYSCRPDRYEWVSINSGAWLCTVRKHLCNNYSLDGDACDEAVLE